MKSKRKVASESLTIDILQIDLADLAELSEAESFGLYQKPGGRFTIGFQRQPDEHSGEGLPELGEREKIDQWQITFDIRASFDHNEGKTFLEVARKGSGTFYSFDFEGIEFWKAKKASGRFNNSFGDFLIRYGIQQLFTSLCWQDSGNKIRQDAYDAIITSFENYFKLTLKPKRKREIEKREIAPGLTITSYDRIETGRNPKKESDKEAEKAKFNEQVFNAFRKLDPKKVNKPTQYQVAMEIFDGNREKAKNQLEKAIGNRLRKFALNWKQLYADYQREHT